MNTWSNKTFAVDDCGLFALRHDFVVPLTQVDATAAISAAARLPEIPLADIVEAITIAINRRGTPQPDWERTRERMRVWRKQWPPILDAICRTLAGDEHGNESIRIIQKRLVVQV